MENYDTTADFGMDLTFKFIEERRRELKIPQYRLAETVGVAKTTLIRNLEKETEMSLRTYLKICGALKLRPYLVPAEEDDSEMGFLHFN